MQSDEFRDETLTLKDGIKLTSRIWKPKDGGPWPALLMRQPYGKEIASTVTYPHPHWWSSHGFLVVIQDVRGQGSSGGFFSGFEQEASDTSQTHSWVRNLPECNGRLGTYGFSYQGMTQLLADQGSPPPDCLAPAMTGLKEKEHWSCDGNAYWWHLGISWGLQLAALKATREKDFEAWEEIHSCLGNKTYLFKGETFLQKYDPKGLTLKWLNTSKKGSSYKWITHKPLKRWLSQPMLLIGGWWDPHLKGIIDIYKQSLEAGGNPELHIGPATHLQWWEGIHKIQLDFFKTHLQQSCQANKTKRNNYLWNLTTKVWTKTQEKNFKVNSWGLNSKGLACLDLSEGLLEKDLTGEGRVTFVHDPWRPVPSTGGHLSPEPGEVDRKLIDERSDVATFTSKKAIKTMTIEGTPILQIEAKSDRETFDICVALSIIKGSDEKVIQLSTGVLRVINNHISKKSIRTISMQPLLADISPGDRIRLSISGSNWPAIGVNPGDEKQNCGAPSPHCLVTTTTLYLRDSKFLIQPLFFK